MDSKYRYMDHNLSQRRRGLEDKIPDIKKTLSMIEFLQERRVSLACAVLLPICVAARCSPVL